MIAAQVGSFRASGGDSLLTSVARIKRSFHEKVGLLGFTANICPEENATWHKLRCLAMPSGFTLECHPDLQKKIGEPSEKMNFNSKKKELSDTFLEAFNKFFIKTLPSLARIQTPQFLSKKFSIKT